ncbi:unnamed protein product, partial [Timema podura]|nr:unnamed protein product [Timema podura]
GLTPMKGFTRRTGKEEQTMVTAGPMCRYAQDLAPFLKVIIGNNISKLKLDEQVTLEDVSFYYMESSGDPRASSINQAMQQALFKAVSHFRELSGHPIQKVTFPEMKYSFRLWRYWMTKEPMVFPEELANREFMIDGEESRDAELPYETELRREMFSSLYRVIQ